MFNFNFELPVAIGSEMFTDGADEIPASQVAGQLGTLIHLEQGIHNLSRDGPRNEVSIYMFFKKLSEKENERTDYQRKYMSNFAKDWVILTEVSVEPSLIMRHSKSLNV